MIEAGSVEELLAGATDVATVDSVWWERRAVEAVDLL